MRKISLTALVIPAALWAFPATAADVAAGKAVAEEHCGECHYAEDWEGETADDIAALIKGVKTGELKHKSGEPKELSDADIANIAAYWATGGE
jgi:cytochrome c553